MEVINKAFSTETDKANFRSELDNALKKRKALKEDTRDNRASKLQREFFDDVSNAEAKPVTENVFLEKDIMNVTYDSNHEGQQGIEEILNGSENEEVLDNLGKARANRMSENIDKVHIVVQYEFQNKNRQMEDLVQMIKLEKDTSKV